MSAPEPASLIARREHRPWPLPAGPWIMRQSWRDLLFAHWPVPAAALRALVPHVLPLDLLDGSAWVGVVPFRVSDARPRGLPGVPGAREFLELNVRTYVTLGGRPGVYFFSLDASSALAVLGARTLFQLRYYEAEMQRSVENGWTRYLSRRVREPAAEFRASYRPAGDVFTAAHGTLDHFLTERYCLYSVGGGERVRRVDIHHPPWPLQPAECTIEHSTMAAAAGIALTDVRPLLHYAAEQHVLVWPPRAAGQGPALA